MSVKGRPRAKRVSSPALKCLAALMITIGMARAYVSYEWVGVGIVVIAVLVGAGLALLLRRVPQDNTQTKRA